CPEAICAVRGWLRPSVEIAECLVDQFEDEALEAALLHEVAHISHNDPVRLLAEATVRIFNPLSYWLGSEFRGWRLAREIQSDRAAVDAGTNPVYLADALVTAARSRSEASPATAHLCGTESAEFEVRVGLLLNGNSSSDHRPSRIGVIPLGLFLMVAATIPHLVGGSLLQLHLVVERLLG
ncbi:MAG: hypothetical protein ABEN55_16475, partial [Bradymonadaceae bacterium]